MFSKRHQLNWLLPCCAGLLLWPAALGQAQQGRGDQHAHQERHTQPRQERQDADPHHRRESHRAQHPPAPPAPVRDPDRIFQQYIWSWRELKRQNIVMQERDFSCGAAALATVLRYFWGDQVAEIDVLQSLLQMLTIDELRDRVENGLTLTDLRRVAVRMGYEAAIGTMEYEKLEESKVPLIIGITVKEYDHFVVYRGTDGQYVYLADPARGNIRVRVPDFIEQWQKNMVLVVAQPGDDDPPEITPLTVRPDEWFLGRMNEQMVRRRLSERAFPPPYAIRP